MAGFPTERHRKRLRCLLEVAAAAGDPHDREVAAALASAAAWSTRPETGTPEVALAQRAAAAARATGDPVRVSAALDAAAFALLGAGRFREAHEINRERLALLDRLDQDDPYTAAEIEDIFITACIDALRAAVHTGARAEAATLVDRAFADFPGTWAQPYAQAAGAELAVVAGLPDAAGRLAAASGAAEHNQWAAACLARATGRLHRDPGAYAAAAGFERTGAHLERAYTLLLLPARAAEGHAHLTARGLPPPPGESPAAPAGR